MFGLLLIAQLAVHVAATPTLAATTGLKCEFTMSAVGNWSDGAAALVQPARLRLSFDAINTDEGTAASSGGMGRSDITARLSPSALHFIQMFRDGPLYVTTVFTQETSTGKLKAVHSRHEETGVRIPGFTSSPEQYYGECEAQP